MIRTKANKKDGSRNSDGNVPNANWNDSKFQVNWYNTDNRNANLRPREEVSHQRSLYGSFDVSELNQLFVCLEISTICPDIRS